MVSAGVGLAAQRRVPRSIDPSPRSLPRCSSGRAVRPVHVCGVSRPGTARPAGVPVSSSGPIAPGLKPHPMAAPPTRPLGTTRLSGSCPQCTARASLRCRRARAESRAWLRAVHPYRYPPHSGTILTGDFHRFLRLPRVATPGRLPGGVAVQRRPPGPPCAYSSVADQPPACQFRSGDLQDRLELHQSPRPSDDSLHGRRRHHWVIPRNPRRAPCPASSEATLSPAPSPIRANARGPIRGHTRT